MRFVIVLFLIALPVFSQSVIDRHMLPLENDEANRLFREGKVEDALKIYQDLYGQDTDNGALAYNLGNAYAARKEMEKAAEFYEKASRSDHEEARLRSQFNMGNIQMASEKPGEALKNYVDYLRARPDDVDAKRNLELALRKLQQQEQEQQKSEDKDEQQDQEKKEQDQQQQEQQQQDQQEKKEQEEQQQEQKEQDQQQQDQQQQGNEDEKKKEEQKKQQQQQQEKESELSEKDKQQILEALKEQEQQQQKEFQKRKIGKTRRRAKDW